MTRTMSISETGLRLIKAFEGYRPTDRELVTGTRVIGYGHRLYSDMPMRMSQEEAEERLILDLSAYEELVNEEVHAPLTQSQFDALVSLAFNIGPKQFRESDTVRALNNGRILDAANGFDIWRKARIGGDSYVVDALMRRRTAEKSLFLRTKEPLTAPGAMLEPVADDTAPLGPTEDDLPTFTQDDTAGFVGNVGYAVPSVERPDETTEESVTDDEASLEANPIETTDDDGPGEVIPVELIQSGTPRVSDRDASDSVETVTVQDTDDDADATLVLDQPADLDEAAIETTASPIAEAADALGERLGKLLDDDADDRDPTADWPDSLTTPQIEAEIVEDDETTRSNLVAFPGQRLVDDAEPLVLDTVETPEVIDVSDDADLRLKRDEAGRPLVIDNLAADDAIRAGTDPEPSVYEPQGDPAENAARYLERRMEPKKTGGGLWLLLIIGSLLLGVSFALLGRGATALLNGWGPVAVIAAAITGGLIVLFTLYAAARGRFG